MVFLFAPLLDAIAEEGYCSYIKTNKGAGKMNLNRTNLSHPRTAWSIEAAMWRAVERSRGRLVGFSVVETAEGKELLKVFHHRGKPGAFVFYADDFNVTDKVLKALRVQE